MLTRYYKPLKTACRSILSFVMLLAAFACFPRTKTPDVFIRPVSSSEIFSRLMANQNKIKSLKAVAKLSILTNDSKNTNTASVEINKRGFTRLTFFNIFFQAAYYFVLNDSKIYVYSADRSSFKVSDVKDDSFLEILGIDIPPFELTALFEGKLPAQVLTENYNVELTKTGYVISSTKHAKYTWVLECRPGDFAITTAVKYIDGVPAFRVEWRNWTNIDGILFPMEVSVSKPSLNSGIILRYKKASLNVVLEDGLFFPSS